MKCAFCGRKNKDNASTCRHCGAAIPKPPAMPDADAAGMPLELTAADDELTLSSDAAIAKDDPIESVAEEAHCKKLSKKTWAILIACAAAVVCVVILVLSLLLSNGVTLPVRNAYTLLYADGAYDIVCRGEAVDYASANDIVEAACTLDCAEAVALTEEGELFYFRGDEARLVSIGVSDFAIASNGRYVVYRIDDGRLYRYDGKKDVGGTALSPESVEPDFVISPDGKSVLFVASADGALCVCVNTKVSELKSGTGLLPISVSRGGKYIYAYEPDLNSIYSFVNRKNRNLLSGDIYGDIWLNANHTEIMFDTTSSGGFKTAYIAIDGNERIELCRMETASLGGTVAMRPVLTASTLYSTALYGAGISVDEHRIFTCPYDTFDGRFFFGNGLVRFGLGETTVDVDGVVDVSFAIASDSCKDLFYVDGSSLVHCKADQFPIGDVITQDCGTQLRISANGKVVWYTDADSTLYRMKLGREPVEVCGKVDSVFVMKNGAAVYLCGDGAYYSKNGKKSTSALSGIDMIFCGMYDMYVHGADGWMLFTSKGQSKPFDVPS